MQAKRTFPEAAYGALKVLDPRPVVLALRDWFGSGLRRRLLGTLGLVMGLISIGLLLLVVDFYRARIGSEQERAASQLNGLLRASLENAMLKRDLPGLEAIVSDLAGVPGVVAVRIVNPSLEVRFASDPADKDMVLDAPALRSAAAGEATGTVVFPVGPDGSLLRAVTPVPNQPQCRECHGLASENPINGILVVDHETGSLGQEARRSALLLLAMGVMVILATTAAVGWSLSRVVVRPVSVLAGAMDRLRAGQQSSRVEAAGTDEIARLGRGFNAMADELQTTIVGLNRSEARLQAVIDAIPDGVRVIGRDYRIMMANQAYIRQVGLPAENIIGRPCHSMSHGRTTPCPDTLIRCPLAELGPGLPAMTCRQTHCSKENVEAHVEVAAALVDLRLADSSGNCVVESIRDLDQQAQLGQEHRLAELGLLAAGLAHEIYNPLSSISLLASALEQEMPPGREGQMAQRMHTLRREIDRTLELTNSLLTLCQPPGEAVLISLADVVPLTLEILGFEARKASAELVQKIPGDLRLVVSESDLRLALTNLVTNALHAVPAGRGRVTVAARRHQGRILIEVADNGCGIAPADLPRVTLPFWTRRADGSHGRGLGLTLVQAAMERAGGRMTVESKLQQGSRFTLDFPDPDYRV